MGFQVPYLLLRQGSESRYAPHSLGTLAVARSKNNAGLFPHCEYEIAISLPLPITINQVELSKAQMKGSFSPCFLNAEAQQIVCWGGGGGFFPSKIFLEAVHLFEAIRAHRTERDVSLPLCPSTAHAYTPHACVSDQSTFPKSLLCPCRRSPE